MQPVYRALAAAALLATTALSHATTTVYTSSAAFLAQVAAGSYTETFTSLSSPSGIGTTFSGSGFSYDAVSFPYGLYLEGGFLGTNQVNTRLSLTFSGAGVTAIGANFFDTDISDTLQSVAITVRLSDGTEKTITPTSLGDSFLGFISTTPITYLNVMEPTGLGLYASLDNLTVGNALAPVPEPASMLLMGLGVAGLIAARRRAA